MLLVAAGLTGPDWAALRPTGESSQPATRSGEKALCWQDLCARAECQRVSGRADRGGVLVGALGGVLALVAVTTGVRGVDLPAATYRVDLFAQRGFTLWDSQWYGGHWLFDYSVLYAPIAWLGGVTATEIISAAVASWAFHRLAAARFATAGRVGALVFATGTLVPVAIGQGPYLMGEAIALLALLAARAGGPVLALPLAVVCSLVAPLAGAFLALAAAAWLVGIGRSGASAPLRLLRRRSCRSASWRSCSLDRATFPSRRTTSSA